MIDPSEKMLHIVYKTFLPYITEHPCFDIMYSNKVGFVKLWINENRDEMTRIETWEELLESICQEIALDVIVSVEEKRKPLEIIEESLVRIEKILNTDVESRVELMDRARKFIYSYLQRGERME